MKHCGICEMWDITRNAEYVATYDSGKTVYLCESCSHGSWKSRILLTEVEHSIETADAMATESMRTANEFSRYSRYNLGAVTHRLAAKLHRKNAQWLRSVLTDDVQEYRFGDDDILFGTALDTDWESFASAVKEHAYYRA